MKKYLLELAGTFAMSFFGPAAIVATLLVPWPDGLSRSFLDALVPGLTLGTCITTFAKYSGSHVNPAITVTFASSGGMKKRSVLPYVIFQLMGALLAGLLLRTIFDSEVPLASLGSNKLGTGVSPIEGIALEVVGTMALCLVVLSVVASVRATGRQAIIVGATLTALIFFLGPISGGRSTLSGAWAPPSSQDTWTGSTSTSSAQLWGQSSRAWSSTRCAHALPRQRFR